MAIGVYVLEGILWLSSKLRAVQACDSPQDEISSLAVKQMPEDWGMILEMLFMMYQPKEQLLVPHCFLLLFLFLCWNKMETFNAECSDLTTKQEFSQLCHE